MKSNKVAISGASGYVGRNVSEFLARNGFDVINIVRKGKKKTINFGHAVISESLTENNLVSSVRGSVALLHFIGTGRQTVDSDFEKVNVELTRNAVALCNKAGIKKILYNSGLGVDKKSTTGYFISKFKAEQIIIKSGLNYTIFRPSYIIGKNDSLTKILKWQINHNRVFIVGSGSYRMQPIFMSDVARVVMQAIYSKEFSRKIIDLVGPKTVTYNRLVRDLLGRKKTKIRHRSFEQAYHDALHANSNDFGIDDLGLIVGDFLGNHKKLAKISRIKFTDYDTMLKSCSLS